MIARNFIRFPEALRFQRELFSNGYHNSPRIMRLMQCIFDWRPTTPKWWTAAKAKAHALAKAVKKSIDDFFKGIIVAPVARERTIDDVPTCARWNPCLHADENDQNVMPGRWRDGEPGPGAYTLTRTTRT